MAAVCLAGIVHEFGHFLMAKLHGHTIRFRFARGTIPKLKIVVPRFIWYMPEGLSPFNKKLVALAGFGLEFLFTIPLWFFKPFGAIYLTVAMLHLISYPFYAGENSDFQWLKKEKT